MATIDPVYYTKIEFGKVEHDGSQKVYFSGEYPAQEYGELVTVQNAIGRALIGLGVEAAHAIGQTVAGIDPVADVAVPPGQAKK